MATTEERVRKLVDDNLEVDGQPIGPKLELDTHLGEAGVSSVDFVAFMKVVAQDFGVEMTEGDCVELVTLRALIEYLDKAAA